MKNLLYILLLFSSFYVKAQNEPGITDNKLREIAVALDSFSNKAPIEKIHIQFDKPYYTLGDTIWMKAYVVNEKKELSYLSKILYAELIDDKDSVVTGLRLPVTAGLAWGAITINDSVFTAGNYRIRAYTNLMRNFGTDYFFNKTISISGQASPFAASVRPSPSGLAFRQNAASYLKDSTGISIQFFPEGGELVNGLATKVAFKAIGLDGLSREISGNIIDQNNNSVTTFRSEHAGMGTFMLQSVAGNSYTAIARFADGSEKRVALPKALQNGYALSVAQNEANIIIKINVSNELLNTGEIMLVGQTANAVQYTGTKQLTKSSLTAVLPKSRFPEGIMQFTLFSADKKPVAERLVFIRHTDQHLKITLTPDKENYKQRDKVHFNIAVTNQQGQPAAGVFSLAVTDDGKLPYEEADEKTIFSNLLLTSDLKGFVEHPNYYFTDTSAAKVQQLDNLLLTQGWRRFIWKNILSGELPPLDYQAENGMGVSGAVLNKKGKPSPGAKVHLLASVGQGLLLDTVADAQGRFNFDDLALGKDVKYNIAATDIKGKKNVTVKVSADKIPAPPPVEYLPTEIPGGYNQLIATTDTGSNKLTGRAKNLLMTNRVNTLKEVEIKETKKTAMEVALKDRDYRLGTPDQVFTFIDLEKTNALGGFLLNRVGNIRIAPKADGSFSATYLGNKVSVLLNGRAPMDGELAAIPPQQIASIEIIKGIRASVVGGTGGVISITLKDPSVDYQPYLDEAEREKQIANAKAIQLKEVEIKAKKENEIQKIAIQYSKNLSGPADQVVTFVDLANCGGDLGTCLASKLMGVRIIPAPLNGWTAVYQNKPMTIIVEGRMVDVRTITADQIAAIEIIKGPRGGVNQGTEDPTPGKPGRQVSASNGAILITLKRGDVNYQAYIDAAEEEKQKAIAKSISLKEVVITDKKKLANIKGVATKNSANLAGPGNADQVVTFLDLLPCASTGHLELCLQGRLVNINIVRSPGNTFGWAAYSRGNDAPMYIVIDGIGGRDPSYLSTDDIASIEVLRGGGAASLYGVKAANGVLIITTKKGDIDYNAYIDEYYHVAPLKPKGIINYKFQSGYDLRRQFYSPDYNNPGTNKQLADLRTTIYWNPNIITDENGKASIDFFNADAKGNYRVITEGLDMDGKLGRQLYKYKVE